MEEGDFQPGISVRLTASPEGGDIDLDGLDQLLLSRDNASEGAMVDLDSDALDKLLSGDNPWLQVATIASSSPSFFDSRSTFPKRQRVPALREDWPRSRRIRPRSPRVITEEMRKSIIENLTTEVMRFCSIEKLFFSIEPLIRRVAVDVLTTDVSTIPRTKKRGISSEMLQKRQPEEGERPRWGGGGGGGPAESGGSSSRGEPKQQRVPALRGVITEVMRKSSIENLITEVMCFCSIENLFFSIEPLIRRVKRGISSEMSQKRQPEEGERTRWGGGGGGGPAESGGSSSRGEPKRQRVPALPEVITEVMRKSSIEKLFFSIESLIRGVAVDVLTTDVSTIPRTKLNTVSYKEAIPEILQVLKAACIIHKLPLAQTWATCAQQGKRGGHHSDENYRYCISTIDAACYVNDPRMQIFHEACSEHHLLPGQGVAGKAFTTNQPCFLPDIGSSSEQEYPLCHHAKILKLKGAVAIWLRCTRAGMADFVLEFFLPRDCGVLEEQKAVLDSLWGTMRSLLQTLRMVTGMEMEDDAMWEMNEINSFDLQNNKKANKRKRMARRSPVWRSFTEVMVGDNVKAKCNHCGLELCCDSKTHGTSSLKSHLERCKLNPNNRITDPL